MTLTRRAALGAAGVAVAGAAVGGVSWWTGHRRLDQLSETVAFDADGRRVLIGPGEASRVVPDSRVLANTSGTAAQLRAEQAWLARSPFPNPSPLLRAALLDLRVLTLPDGAALAGWPTIWHYVWPRDAAFTAVALAVAGHSAQATQVLEFLAQAQNRDSSFSARYLPDGLGPPDSRPRQNDGWGWVCWAAACLHRLGTTLTAPVRTMVIRSTQMMVDGLGRGSDLPSVSPDWWEVAEDELTLGVAAAHLLGLESAVALGVPGAMAGVERIRPALFTHFGPQFGRHGRDAVDASITFLLPPFRRRDPDSDAVHRAMVDALPAMRRDAGGYAPGAGWKRDGISWTPATTLICLARQGMGESDAARGLLDWVDRHRTTAGSIPEKVLYDGSPAGPAPLSWSAANVVLVSALAAGGSLARWAA